MPKKPKPKKDVAAIRHDKQTRAHNPTAEMEEVIGDAEKKPVRAEYPRKNNPSAWNARDKTPERYRREEELDPQLVWRGKDAEDRERLVVNAAPIYTHEKIHPQAIIDNLRRRAAARRAEQPGAPVADLYADFNGLPGGESAQLEFYRHQKKWTNRMILGDSLSIMSSLAHKEGLKGKTQCVYMDPPYGISFASNWQPSTKSASTGDSDETREPGMIQAFRDTWKDGVNSYLSYLRDRLVVARDLLTESGSLFLQIGDKNVHLVRSLMDEVFGAGNFVAQIILRTRSTSTNKYLSSLNDYILWFAKNYESLTYRTIYREKEESARRFNHEDHRGHFASDKLVSTSGGKTSRQPFVFNDVTHIPADSRGWRCSIEGLERLAKADRIFTQGNSIRYKYYHSDLPVTEIANLWEEQISEQNKSYVVQTGKKAIQRCILMSTDPGDLVIDPTCGSGTTAAVAEQWGRRWITMDTSRVALAIARRRLMSDETYDYYLMQDSEAGAKKEAEIIGKPTPKKACGGDIGRGFVYKRAPHITLKSIANNGEIDSIWERAAPNMDRLLVALNAAVGENWREWEVPPAAKKEWSAAATDAHAKWRKARAARQKEMDDSIAKNAETEHLVDRPHKAKNIVRVTGPFTMESLSPHRILPVDEKDESESGELRPKSEAAGESRFLDVIRENLQKSGVKIPAKKENLKFSAVEPAPAACRHFQYVGHYEESGEPKKAAICVGPEYDAVSLSLIVKAAREAGACHMLIILGFAFEPRADEKQINNLSIPAIRARMNNDLHMADRLVGKESDNLFVSFGEPDIVCRRREDGMLEAEIRGIDIFDPATGEVKSDGVENIACWMIDTDYNEESFFVRHAYFTGGGKDPYATLKRALNGEVDEADWRQLRRATSFSFPEPESGKIAVKAINHYGDEVLKVIDIKDIR